MDFARLCQDHNIPHFTEGKNVSPGWVNVQCCWCSDNSNHLGFSPSGSFVCWRCGAHPLRETLARLLRVDENAAYELVRHYGGQAHGKPSPTAKMRLATRTPKLPTSVGPLTGHHRNYLRRRGFDPYRLEQEWGLLGAGPTSQLDGISFKHRIVIPINWDGKRVSFTARDVTGRAVLRYLSCPPEREAVSHKSILYGREDCWGPTGVCVEGPTDVWRLGPAAFATFGTQYTLAQVNAIAQRFERVVVVYDDEPEAQGRAKKLVAELRFRGVEARRETVPGDPGGLPQDEADLLMRRWLR